MYIWKYQSKVPIWSWWVAICTALIGWPIIFARDFQKASLFVRCATYIFLYIHLYKPHFIPNKSEYKQTIKKYANNYFYHYDKNCHLRKKYQPKKSKSKTGPTLRLRRPSFDHFWLWSGFLDLVDDLPVRPSSTCTGWYGRICHSRRTDRTVYICTKNPQAKCHTSA